MIGFSLPADAGIIDTVSSLAGKMPKEIYRPMKPSQAPEIYGPTPINAQIGNQGLSIGIRKNGTVSTYSFPRPSMYDQVKFHTTSRGKDNWGAAANSGLQLGLQVKAVNGSKEVKDECIKDSWWIPGCQGWSYKTVPTYGLQSTMLRNWEVTEQKYKSPLNDVVVTTLENDDLEMEVTITDLVPINKNVSTDESGDPGTYSGYSSDAALPGDALIRKVEIDYNGQDDKPVKYAKLFSYANFNMVGKHHPLVPTADWAEQITDMEDAYYSSGMDSIIHADPDRPGGGKEEPNRMIAMGFDNKNASAHEVQVGYDNVVCTSISMDCAANFIINGTAGLIGQSLKGAYAYFENNHKLDSDWTNSPNNPLWGPTLRSFFTSTGMTSEKLFDNGGHYASKKIIFANVSREWTKKTSSENTLSSPENYLETLMAEARNIDFSQAVDAKEDWYRSLLEGAPIPDANNAITKLSKRSLVTLVQNYDPRSGAIVASIARQSPYAEDWPRDGAYFNYILDHKLGLHQWVRKRNNWYASLQEGPNQHISSLLIPKGNWAMNYYGNGKVGGVIPWEVDETGYMVWAFWDHYKATKNISYLENIYPNMKLAADFLVDFEDPSNHLQKPAHEDDHFTKSQTLVGANTTWLAMKAAEKAAETLGKTEDAEKYRQRKEELGRAINRVLWNSEKQAWGTKHWGIAEIAWPSKFRDWGHNRMQNHLDAAWSKVKTTFKQPFEGDVNTGGNSGLTNSQGIVMGLYETKFLIPMAMSANATGNDQRLQKVKTGLNWVAKKWATPETHIMGEVWMKCGNPETAWPCDDPNSVFDYEDQIVSTVSQPHAWEQILFYLGATETYQTNPLDGPNSGYGGGYYGGYGY
jgi:hypothetical protein